MNLKSEIKELYGIVKSLNKKTLIIFISVILLLILSWYITSRQFFRDNFYYTLFQGNANADLFELIYWLTGDFIVLLLIPVIIIRFFLRDRISDYGINLKEKAFGFKTALFLILPIIIVLWIVSSDKSFLEIYPLLKSARENWLLFIFYQALLILFLFAWEFFFRGYMLFGLKKEFGYYSIFIQMLPFVMLHFGKPAVETIGAVAGALALGVLAYRTGSMFYGFIIHYIVMLFIDLFSVLRYRTGIKGIGADTFFQLLSKLF